MKPAPFKYLRPQSLEAVTEMLWEHGSDAQVLAGGQSLVPLLNARRVRPAVIVDINRVGGLDGVEVVAGALHAGALVRHRAALVSRPVAASCPLLADALAQVGYPETRNRGTLGGSIAHADPAAELPVVMAALDGEVVLRSARGERSLPVTTFLQGPYATACEPTELVTGLRLGTAGSGWVFQFQEVRRRHHDFAVVLVAVGLRIGDDGAVADARLAYGGAGPTAVRAAAAEDLVRGERPGEDLFAEAAASAAAALAPESDVEASAQYRRHAAVVLTKRMLADLAHRATREDQ